MKRAKPSGPGLPVKFEVVGKLVVIGLLLLAGCEQTEENVTDGGIEEGRTLAACSEPLLKPAAILANRKRDAELRRDLAKAKADPLSAARDALEVGDYRLIADGSEADLSEATFGIRCAVANGLDPWSVRGIMASPEASGLMPARLAEFARQYNQAIVSDPAYPYADICRPADPSLTPTRTNSGFVELAAPTTAYDAAEAARRGDAWRLRQLRRRDPALLDASDMFGMTPLAWAVAYREPYAIDYLLKAGADPTGTGCRVLPDARAPIELARAMKWQSAVLRMRPMLGPGIFEELREEPRMREDSEIAYRGTLRRIAGMYEKQLMQQKRSIQRVTFQIDAKGQATSCALDPGTEVPDFDAEICANGIDQLRWYAARNPFGVEVPGETTISVRVLGF
jgi:hypothetical protein